jgi:hypothetical protein
MSKFVKFEMTWESTLPLLLAILADGDSKGRKFAREELQRMARAADAMAREAPAEEVDA